MDGTLIAIVSKPDIHESQPDVYGKLWISLIKCILHALLLFENVFSFIFYSISY